jgi:mevalonate pyrophosphate decarboxylase
MIYFSLGSGSACRSLFGGFALWEGNTAVQLFPQQQWSELTVLIVVVRVPILHFNFSYDLFFLQVEPHKKKVPSTVGMKRSVETSILLQV